MAIFVYGPGHLAWSGGWQPLDGFFIYHMNRWTRDYDFIRTVNSVLWVL